MAMHIITGIIVFLICYFLYNREQERKTEKEMDSIMERVNQQETDSNENNMIENKDKIATKDLLLEVLNDIGCEKEEMDDGHIRFAYQGISFLAYTGGDYPFVNLIWPWCHSFSSFDIDEFARARKIVNELNLNTDCTLCYSNNKESDEIAVHIRYSILFITQIPQLSDYFRSKLNQFFATQRELMLRIEKEKIQEKTYNA
jgi:hypothetical protein